MTEASKRAYMKYNKKFEKMQIRLPEGKLEKYHEAASKAGMSLNAYVIYVLDQAQQESVSRQQSDNCRR